MFESVNPATGEVLERHDAHTEAQVDQILETAHETHREWRRVPMEERADLMRRAGRILRDRTGEYAELMAKEMGKPVSGGRSEAEKCAWLCDYYADQAAGFLAEEAVETDAAESFVTYQPLGVILAIMPWNFPFWQVFRFAVPNLMAGNAGVLKHASNVFGSALAIEQIFRDAGVPEGLFRAVLIGSDRVEDVIQHARVRGVTLTGSTPAGRAVAGAAGAELKKTVLELGGSDPYVVLEDTDLDETVSTCVTSRLINSGQSCIAAKRFIVVEPLRGAFEEKFVTQMKARRLGDPLDPETDIGPQAREDLRKQLHEQVRRSVDAGARLLLGGEVPGGPGAFYPATVLTDVKPGMPAFEEELFGPVAAIIGAKDEEEAIQKANASPFGLGAAVFTRDVEKGRRIAAEELEAGCCFVNAFVRSDPRLPFGGVKQSGYGRELAEPGIKEFVNVKTVYVSR